MNGDFSSKLQAVLSDPDALAKITAIASSLGSSPKETPPASEEPAASPVFSEPALPSVQYDPRINLLSSIKPLLREDRRGRVDSLVTALTVASMLKSFRK